MSEKKIKIAAFILCYNEEKILPHTIKHYKTFCEKIYIINNCSTDNTVKIAKELNCEIINCPPEYNEINEINYLNIKQNYYKQYRGLYDYVIVCDADEFLYHPNLFDYLKNNEHIDILKCVGYDMVYDNFNFETDDYKKIVDGVHSPGYSKCAIFKPHVDIVYEAGCHTCYVPHQQTDIQLRHLKYINIEYLAKRYEHYLSRLSAANIHYKWGIQYHQKLEEIKNGYDYLIKNSIKLNWD